MSNINIKYLKDENNEIFSPVVSSDSILTSNGKGICDLIYPVGSVYMSLNSTNPQYLFGGTWTKIEGRFLWATGSTPGVTGGSKTTDGTALTIWQMPAHTHKTGIQQTRAGNMSEGNASAYVYYDQTLGADTTSTGGGQKHAHTFMPPYFEVYMWYRIS